MSPTGLIASILLLTLVIVIVALPFFQMMRQKSAVDDAAMKQQDGVIAYYERALQNIRDLDEDHALGKISEASYCQDRELWTQRGVQALKLLDQLAESSEPAGNLDAVIEKMVAQSRDKQAASTTQAQL